MIETDEESAAEILFADGSKLSVGENSAVAIDTFVYDGASGQSVLQLTRGVFRYVSGSMPNENVEIVTPTVTVGIRGTELVFTVNNDGSTEMSTIAGEAICTSRRTRRVLRVLALQSALAGADGVWAGGVRAFVHATRSAAIDGGFGEARRRWRIRKARRRRTRRRIRNR